MEKYIKRKGRNWPLYLSALVISTLAVAACILLVNIYSDRVIRTHTYAEMKVMAATQAEIIDREIQAQFTPLNLLAETVKSGETFAADCSRQVLEALKTENRFCALGFANQNGDAVNYDGTSIGNIADRDYFAKIISGEKENCVEYLPTTLRVEEPRFLFSVPVRDGDRIVGVVFASKKVSVISDVLLCDTLFDGSERIYIADENYSILAANTKGEEKLQQTDLPSIIRFFRENKDKGGFIAEQGVYAADISVSINQWQMICVLEKENAEAFFADISASLKQVANIVSIILLAALLYTVLMTRYRVAHYMEGERQMFNQYSSYHTLLEKMNCAFVEYHVSSDTLTANQFFMDKYAENEPGDCPITMQRLQEIHPEFNYKELDEAIELVKKTNRPYSFETAITFTDGKVYWVEITAIPQADLNGHITDILAALVDTTPAHERIESDEVISNIPNGIHRCYLSDPIHMEFASKGMCQMLGYTEEELSEELTSDRKLGRLVHPEDLDKFRQFVCEAARKEGRFHCEYRMRKKDGSYISVLDVMEVKRAGSGVMYGYSSVTDITDFQRAEEMVNAKLRAAEEEIEKHINQKQKLIAAKREAEERYRQEAMRILEKTHIAQEEANQLVRAISSINSDYSAIYFVDFAQDRYQLCKTTDLMRRPVMDVVKNRSCFSTTIKQYIDAFVADEDKAFMYANTASDAICTRLAKEEQFFLRYRLKENSNGQVNYEMHIVDCSTDDNERKAAVGFRCLDAAIAEENKHRLEVEELESRLKNAQLKNSMSQMQPHFLYNALASIREIVLDDPQYASDLIYDFSTHLRACIRAMSNNDMVPFEQELDNINAYVNIEKMRFGDKLRTVFDIQSKDFNIVPLSIQPLVENAIRHGIYQRGAAGGTVTVSTEQTKEYHVIKVSDDGVGFDYEQILREIEEKKRDSTGLTNLTFRLKKMMNAETTVNSTRGKGTVVTVRIPRTEGRTENENDSCR